MIQVIFLLLVSASVCFGQAFTPNDLPFISQVPSVVTGGGGGGITGDLVDENCEGTGTPSGWTDSPVVNWDDTTSPMQGSQQLSISAGGSTTKGFTSQTTAYGHVMVRLSSLPGSTITMCGFRNSGSAVALARVNTTGNMSIFANGSDSTFTTDALSAGVDYHVWWSFTSGGTCTVEFSTDGTRTGSGNKFTSKTGAATSVNQLTLNMSWKFDRLVANTTQIGNNP